MERRISQLESAADRIGQLAERRSAAAGGNTNSSNININAGGLAVWIQAAIAGMTFTALIVAINIGSSWISDRFSRMDAEIVALKAENAENKVFLQDIWRQAPHLKPKENK